MRRTGHGMLHGYWRTLGQHNGEMALIRTFIQYSGRNTMAHIATFADSERHLQMYFRTPVARQEKSLNVKPRLLH